MPLVDTLRGVVVEKARRATSIVVSFRARLLVRDRHTVQQDNDSLRNMSCLRFNPEPVAGPTFVCAMSAVVASSGLPFSTVDASKLWFKPLRRSTRKSRALMKCRSSLHVPTPLRQLVATRWLAHAASCHYFSGIFVTAVGGARENLDVVACGGGVRYSRLADFGGGGVGGRGGEAASCVVCRAGFPRSLFVVEEKPSKPSVSLSLGEDWIASPGNMHMYMNRATRLGGTVFNGPAAALGVRSFARVFLPRPFRLFPIEFNGIITLHLLTRKRESPPALRCARIAPSLSLVLRSQSRRTDPARPTP